MNTLARSASALSLAVLAGLVPASAYAQAKPDVIKQDEVSPALRFVFLGGDDGLGGDWSDDFGTGGGLEIVYSHLWPQPDRMAAGAYTSLSLDGFGGSSTIFFDPTLGPLLVELDDLFMVRLLGGFRGRLAMGRGYIEANLGAGLAAYSNVDVEVTAPGVVLTGSGIEASINYALEAGLRMGARLSPSVAFGVGLDYELNGPPDMNEDLLSSAKSQKNIVFTVGVDFGF